MFLLYQQKSKMHEPMNHAKCMHLRWKLFLLQSTSDCKTYNHRYINTTCSELHNTCKENRESLYNMPSVWETGCHKMELFFSPKHNVISYQYNMTPLALWRWAQIRQRKTDNLNHFPAAGTRFKASRTPAISQGNNKKATTGQAGEISSQINHKQFIHFCLTVPI